VFKSAFRSAVLLIAAGLFFASAPHAYAQQGSCQQDDPPPPPECWSVSVTPQGGVTPVRTANTSGHTATFTVTNTGNPDTYRPECSSSRILT